MANNQAPIIIRKVIEEGGHGHHGGAWKVAYADFVTAMMAFFLMLWLLGTQDEAKLAGLAEFFTPNVEGQALGGGVGGVLSGVSPMSIDMTVPQSLSPFTFHPSIPLAEGDQPEDAYALDLTADPVGDPFAHSRRSIQDAVALEEQALREELRRREEEQFDEAAQAIKAALNASPELQAVKDSLLIDRTEEGLRLQIVDRHDQAMFALSSARLLPHTRDLLALVAEAVADLPQALSIRGHTDALPFANETGYDNWDLSADRANATRRGLVDAGLLQNRVREVVGRGATEHLVPETPTDPRNRRISLVLLRNNDLESERP